MKELNEMKLVQLQIENIFGIKAVNLKLDGKGALLIGANEAGKSSVIDSLGWLLQIVKDGEALRNGERKGFVKADFGDITVERTVKKSGQPVYKIESKNGEKLTPKELFDNFINSITFKPAEWLDKIKKNKNEGIRELFSIAGVDIEKYENEKKELAQKRRDIGRDRKQIEGKLSAIGMPDNDIPNEEVSVSDLNKELEKYREKAKEYESLNIDLRRVAQDLEITKERYKQTSERVIELQKQLDIEKEKLSFLDGQSKDLNNHQKEIAKKIKSTKTYEYEINNTLDKIHNAEKTNQAVRAKMEYNEQRKEFDKLDKLYEDMTEQLKSMEDEIKEKLQDSELPKGFEIENGEIYLNSVKFDRLSTFQKLDLAMQVGVLLGKNGNTQRRLKVLCMDISQYDENNRSKVVQLAEKNGFQGIFEVATTNAGDYDNAFLIEDGEVRTAGKVSKAS